MRYYSKVWFPDASLLSAGWVDTPEHRLVGVGAQGKFREAVVIDGIDLDLDGTARGGRVIFSLLAAGQIVTHAAVVSGAEPNEDAELLKSVAESTRRTNLVKELAIGQTAPFQEIMSQQERPFCATVLIPLASKAVTDAVLHWHHRWVSSHLGEVLEAT
jgi:hypothetical protein